MKFDVHFKLKSRHLMILLAVLGFALIAMAGLGLLGVKVPPKVASDVSNGAIIGALVIFFYNRKLRADEVKARAERDATEKEKAAAAISDEAGEGGEAGAAEDRQA
ncbi:MAG: hypothetical protein M0Z80_11630 [Treponema sp.]|nr:hypothetical protein [Treponema sp.]